MLFFILATLLGLALLGWSADRFVTGAASLARNLGISTLIIGLTIVAFGTSAPEMLVSAMAAWQGNSGLAIGNAIGSNIANVGLVLGLTALLIPLTVQSNTLRREFPLLLVVTLGTFALLWDAQLGRIDGIILVAGLFMIIAWTVHLARQTKTDDPITQEMQEELAAGLSTRQAFWLLLSGLILLLLASRMLVWGAVGIAEHFGVSDLVIGLTIVAIGTSLPELAASIAAVRKGEDDIAVGNIVGSNLFNLLAVLGIAGLIGPGPVDAMALSRDYPLMLGMTIMLFILAGDFHKPGPGRIVRWEGAALFSAFIGYQGWLVYISYAG
ncbi:calcium/sodium antiporter [Candidatus Venteria ishoeyi]|nr:calcium/sodium antiporter [Candidatus Venteria ishoeyi]